MDTKKLRQKILDLAIRGKLVPQDPNDEPASVLLERIRAEKERLIAEGKIKRPKKSKASSAESHYRNFTPPFPIPESWEWVILDELAIYKKGPFGSSLTKSMFVPESENAFKVYEQKNAIQKDASLGRYYITQEKFDELKGFAVAPGDIIVSCAGTIGETYVLPNNCKDGIINQALMIIRLFRPEILEYYLEYFNFVLKASATKDSKGTAIKNIPPFEILKAYPFPLPPIAEQQRIVEATKQFDRLFETLNNNRDQIVNRITRIKAKILNIAMQGKLVPQDPTDEPAADMLRRINPKAKIITDNPHYPQLPKNWVLTTIDSVCLYGNGKTIPVSDINAEDWVLELEDMESYTGRLLQIKRKKDRAISGTRHSFKSGDVLFSRLRTYLNKVILSTKDGFCSTEMIPITPFKCVIPEYLYYWLRSPFFIEYTISCGYGVKMPRLSSSAANKAIVPLPSLEEQYRIVTSIKASEEIFDHIVFSLS